MNETIGPESRWPVQWTDRLQRLATNLSGVVDPASMAQQAVAQVQAALDADAGVVFLLSPDGESLQIAHASGYEARTSGPWTRFPLTANLPVTDAVRTREAVLVGSREELVQRYPELAATPGALTRGSWAAVPLVADDVCIGALGLSFGAGHTFEAPKVAFLRVVADQCAQALHRADLAERERQSTARLRVLAEASRVLAAASLDVASVLNALGREVLAHVGDSCSIALASPDGEWLEVAVIHDRDPRAAEAPARGGRQASHAARRGPLGKGVRHRERRADRRPSRRTRWRNGPRPRSPGRSRRFASTACSRLRSRRAGGRWARSPPRATTRTTRSPTTIAPCWRTWRIAPRWRSRTRGCTRSSDEARARAEEADQHKDEFLAMLGHELRNPLAPIWTALEIMRQLPPSDDRQVWAREAIARQVAQLSRLVDDLLDVSRINLGKIDLRVEPLDLGVVALQALEASRPLLSERDHEVYGRLPRSRPRARRRRPAHAGHRQPAQQRREVHRSARSRAPPRRVRRQRSDRLRSRHRHRHPGRHDRARVRSVRAGARRARDDRRAASASA